MAGVACRDDPTADHGRADVMRGEETQIFGAIRLDPGLWEARHVAVLPGTHSKWVTLDDGHSVAFRTFLTGELYTLLQGSSVLAAGRETGAGFSEEGLPCVLSQRRDE